MPVPALKVQATVQSHAPISAVRVGATVKETEIAVKGVENDPKDFTAGVHDEVQPVGEHLSA